MEVSWKISSPGGEFKDTVFNDWRQLCTHLLENCNGAKFPILIDVVLIASNDAERWRDPR